MRNIFLCFLTVMLFAPSAVFAAGASRLTPKNETNVDAIRSATNVRAGTNRTGVTSVRSDKSVSRDKDAVPRSAVNRATDSNSRSASSLSVVSRSSDKIRNNTNVKPLYQV